jgi:hypothetical protein
MCEGIREKGKRTGQSGRRRVKMGGERNKKIIRGEEKGGRQIQINMCLTKGGVVLNDFETCFLSSDIDEKYKFSTLGVGSTSRHLK